MLPINPSRSCQQILMLHVMRYQSTEEIEIQEIEFQQTSQDEDEPTRAKADIHAIVAAVSSAKSEVTASTKTDDDDDAGDVILIDEVPTN
mmetsp:Transcript_5175/g.6752  ORF Transcript_5175/g.6752 Transcript_5175/m.6752 type:complete len:90 (+) Transcript_5175:327-596(+)